MPDSAPQFLFHVPTPLQFKWLTDLQSYWWTDMLTDFLSCFKSTYWLAELQRGWKSVAASPCILPLSQNCATNQINWLTDSDLLTYWPTDWLTCWFTYLLTDRLTDIWTDLLTDGLTHWLGDLLTDLLSCWLLDWLTCWLIYWSTCWLTH